MACCSDYLSELGPNAQSLIFNSLPGGKLDRAMIVAYNNTRDFMMTAFNLTEDEAISAMTVGADFIVTQASLCILSSQVSDAGDRQRAGTLSGVCVRGRKVWPLMAQVVDGAFGIHSVIPKWMFMKNDGLPYVPTIAPGSSTPLADIQAMASKAKAVQPNYLNGPVPVSSSSVAGK